MATFAFQPTASTPFQFQPELDGSIYTGIVTWNIFRMGWYLNLFALDGTRVVTLPLIGSPDDADISMTKGYFNSTLVFRDSSQTFEVTP
jgi:hypothetical protein